MDEPLSFRYILQPTLALLLGFRDGSRDAREGLPYYALSLLTKRTERRELLLEGLHMVALPLSVAILMDALVQFLVSEQVVVWKALVMGTLLIGLPYILSRGATNHLITHYRHRRPRRPA